MHFNVRFCGSKQITQKSSWLYGKLHFDVVLEFVFFKHTVYNVCKVVICSKRGTIISF